MSSSSSSLLHKYFPYLHTTSNATLSTKTSNDIFCSPLSISAFSAAVLGLTHDNNIKSTALLRLHFHFPTTDLFSNFQTVVVRQPNRLLQFANIGQLASVVTKEEREEEKGGDRIAGRTGKAGGKSSWSELPKFLLAGAISTIVSRTFVAPLERIKLECIVQGTKQTWIKTIRWIWVSEGLFGFWKGNLLNLFRMVPFKSINFICYDMYCDQLLHGPDKKEITNHDRLIGGGISGLIATVICLPLDTIRTRLVAPGGNTLGGVAGCFTKMVQKEGFLSLYKGLTPALLSMGPASAVFYFVYDILKASYLARAGKTMGDQEGHELGAIRTLIYGAIAGACSETVTYPLEVIRRQLQLQQASRLGLISAFTRMVEREGVASLFAGLVPSTLQVLPSASLSYLFYEMMKSILKIN